MILRNVMDSDAYQLAQLISQLGYNTTELQMKARLNLILAQEEYQGYVVVNERLLLGFAGINKEYLWESDGCYVKIQALIVHENYRKMGVGKLLLDEVECYAKSINARYIALTSGNKEARKEAHLFYPAQGFKATSIGYKKYLITP